MAKAGVKAHHWTREEYERVVETGAFEGWKIELVGGVLHDMAPKSPQHTGTLHKLLTRAQRNQLRKTPRRASSDAVGGIR